MKLLDQVRAKLRLLHYAWDTEQSYVRWIERFLVFHKSGDTWRHPNEMGHAEIERFLTHLAHDRNVSATRRLTPNALNLRACIWRLEKVAGPA